MRRLALLLALLPLSTFAEIPIVDLVSVAPLQGSDGTTECFAAAVRGV